jgi:MiaB/RimO family radical SAM methylthiotransferase
MRQLLNRVQFLTSREKIDAIPSLKTFMRPADASKQFCPTDGKPTFHIETYGCQMNVNDSEIVRSVLSEHYTEVSDPKEASVLLLNTCAIREKAEERVFSRIRQASKQSAIAVLGCMAERLKKKMFAAGVQVVCGPDAYRDLPRLIGSALVGRANQMNVALSAEETYADINPVRRNPSSVTAFLSIMRGCNNMCSFCIVPFVRGRERSRNLGTILEEIAKLESEGVKEITFLGQNVNSYHDLSSPGESEHSNAQGFQEMFKLRDHPGARFANLLTTAAGRFPNVRFRFTSPHPKDFSEEVIEAIRGHHNICKYVHLPAQSGNTEMLFRMRRNHSRESFVELATKMRGIPGMALSTDMIAGFCGETEAQFEDVLCWLASRCPCCGR